MTTNTENSVVKYSPCLKFQQMQPKHKVIPHELPAKSWEMFRATCSALKIVVSLYSILLQQIPNNGVGRKTIS